MNERSLPDDDPRVTAYRELHNKAADRDLYYTLGNFAGAIFFGVASGNAESASITANVAYTSAWFCSIGACLQFGRVTIHLVKSTYAGKFVPHGPAPTWHPESELSRMNASPEEYRGDDDDDEPPVGV